MGHRLSKIVTRTGDQGSTDFGRQQRCVKNDLQIEIVGELDELNCQVGVAVAECCAVVPHEHPKLQHDMIHALQVIQNDLFDVGGSLVVCGLLVKDSRVHELEQDIENWLAYLPATKEFILPGGHSAAAQLHLARSVCRRVERRWWQAFAVSCASADHSPQERDSTDYVLYLGQYLNRLSDWFFVAARLQNKIVHSSEVLWSSGKK